MAMHVLMNMAMHVLMNYYVFNGKNLGYNCLNVELRYLAGLTRHKRVGNGQFNPVIFERRAVTSPTALVTKGRHHHWD